MTRLKSETYNHSFVAMKIMVRKSFYERQRNHQEAIFNSFETQRARLAHLTNLDQDADAEETRRVIAEHDEGEDTWSRGMDETIWAIAEERAADREERAAERAAVRAAERAAVRATQPRGAASAGPAAPAAPAPAAPPPILEHSETPDRKRRRPARAAPAPAPALLSLADCPPGSYVLVPRQDKGRRFSTWSRVASHHKGQLKVEVVGEGTWSLSLTTLQKNNEAGAVLVRTAAEQKRAEGPSTSAAAGPSNAPMSSAPEDDEDDEEDNALALDLGADAANDGAPASLVPPAASDAGQIEGARVKIEETTAEAIDVDDAAEDSVVKVDVEGVTALQRRLMEEQAALDEGHAASVAAQQEQEAQRSKRRKVFHENKDKVFEDPIFKCPSCYFLNLYEDKMCNKLECGNCKTKICIKCGKLASASCRCIVAAWARA